MEWRCDGAFEEQCKAYKQHLEVRKAIDLRRESAVQDLTSALSSLIRIWSLFSQVFLCILPKNYINCM